MNEGLKLNHKFNDEERRNPEMQQLEIMKQQQVMKKTDLEMIPEVAELRRVLRETKFREGKLVVPDLPAYVESVKKVIPIYQELIGRRHFKETTKYAAYKLEIITTILKNNYGIEVCGEKK